MHITLFITSYTYSKIHCICPCIHLGCVNWNCSNLRPFADSPRCSARNDKVAGEAKGEPLRWNIKISRTSSHRGKLWNLPPNHWLDWDVISYPNFPDLVVESLKKCGWDVDAMRMRCRWYVHQMWHAFFNRVILRGRIKLRHLLFFSILQHIDCGISVPTLCIVSSLQFVLLPLFSSLDPLSPLKTLLPCKPAHCDTHVSCDY